MSDFYGNQISGKWRGYIDSVSVINDYPDRAVIRAVCGFQATGWGFQVHGLRAVISINENAKSEGGKNVSLPSGSWGKVGFIQHDVSVPKDASGRNVRVAADVVNESGYYNGVSHVEGSIWIGAKQSYTISYNANGGSGAPGNQTRWYGQSDFTISTTRPTRTGYTFQGWSTSNDSSVEYQPGQHYGGDANLTLYAVWKVNTWTVSYNANGGSGAPGNQTKVYGQTLTLSSTRPTRNLYNFRGWGTSSGSTTPSYQPGGAYTNNASITLYAIWELAWVAPRITNLQATRCTSDGTLNDEGTYAKVSFNWATDRTVSSIKIVCNGETINGSGSGTSGSVSLVLGKNLLSTDNPYTVTATITDSVGSASDSTVIAPMNYIIDVNGANNTVAFGGPATDSNRVISNMQIAPRKGFTYSSSFTGTLGKGQWIKLGTLSSTNDADSAIIDVYSGHGWNASPMQNSWFRIFIKDSYQASSSTSNAFGVYVYCYNCDSRDIKVDVRAHAPNQCDVWIYLSWGYWAGGYDIKTNGRWTPGPGSISQSEEPTSGTLQQTRVFSAAMMEYGNGYLGFVNPSANNSSREQDHIRVTGAGLIPDRAGGSSSLGTEGWPFGGTWTNSLSWTGNGLRGRVMKQIWSGSCSINGTITCSEFPRYNLFAARIHDWTTMLLGANISVGNAGDAYVRFHHGYDNGSAHYNYYASFNRVSSTQWKLIGGCDHNMTTGVVNSIPSVTKIYGIL